MNGAQGRLAVEIVVTHEPEPSAVSAYRSDNIPVMIVRPTWGTLRELYWRVRAGDALNIPEVCPSCEKRENEKRLADAEDREKVRQSIREWNKKYEMRAWEAHEKQIQAIRAMRGRETGLTFSRWDVDRFGNPMYGRPQSKVFASAQRLVNRGWRQDAIFPWLFSYRLEYHTIYADFGGNKRFPIYRYPKAQVYAHPRNKQPRLSDERLERFQRYTEREVMQAMKSFGVHSL